jgi:predicted HAD superfamily Cof-like phosphohydrolase
MSHSHCSVMLDGHELCAGIQCHLSMDERCEYHHGAGLRTAQNMVRAFHKKYDCTWNDKPTQLDYDDVKFRIMLVEEEAKELVEAMEQMDMVQIADAIADTLYVVLGTAVAYGIDASTVFAEVQRSNMTKTHAGAHNAKPLKGIPFSKPQLAKLLDSMERYPHVA